MTRLSRLLRLAVVACLLVALGIASGASSQPPVPTSSSATAFRAGRAGVRLLNFGWYVGPCVSNYVPTRDFKGFNPAPEVAEPPHSQLLRLDLLAKNLPTSSDGVISFDPEDPSVTESAEFRLLVLLEPAIIERVKELQAAESTRSRDARSKPILGTEAQMSPDPSESARIDDLRSLTATLQSLRNAREIIDKRVSFEFEAGLSNGLIAGHFGPEAHYNEDLNDLMQDARIALRHAIENQARANKPIRSSYWLAYRVAFRIARKAWFRAELAAKRSVRVSYLDEDNQQNPTVLAWLAGRPTQNKELATQEFRRLLEASFEALPDKQEEALILIDGCGLTAIDAGKKLNETPATVQKRATRGRIAVAENFKKEAGVCLSGRSNEYGLEPEDIEASVRLAIQILLDDLANGSRDKDWGVADPETPE